MSERGEYNELTAPQLRELIKLIREQNEEILAFKCLKYYLINMTLEYDSVLKHLSLLVKKPKLAIFKRC